MSGELYSDYMQREPHPRNAVFIKNWHGKILSRVFKQLSPKPLSVLEIGPGHGYFAQHCRDSGISYEFCDTSPAVFTVMKENGFKGHLGLLGEVKNQLGKYDIVWMSHVLEHSPTWLAAREMIALSSEVLNVGGSVIVVGPDAMSWKKEFLNVDWSHGYPTTIRNVCQLFNDVGLKVTTANHHRNGSTNPVIKAVFAIISLVPHRLIDRVLTPKRSKIGDGLVYSWKAVFGWRQILVVGQKSQ